jgi:hypothetical protein
MNAESKDVDMIRERVSAIEDIFVRSEITRKPHSKFEGRPISAKGAWLI